MKTGFIALIGRPNVGKSTLLNNIMKNKISIISNKPQTTRNAIQGIYNDNESQIIFIDTPGIHKPNHKLGKYLNHQAYYSISDADVVLFLVDINEKLGSGDKFIIEKFNNINKPIILILNKIDKIKKEDILYKIDEYRKLYEFDEIIPLSAIKKDSGEYLVNIIKKYLNTSEKYYDDNIITNVSTNFLITEIIREKILQLTEKEVPHSITCVLEEIKTDDKKMVIYANIIVDRDSLKKIIIGKSGVMLKEIGTKARIDLEKLFNKKIYLELYVKTIKKWRDKDDHLNNLGFKIQ